MRFCGRRFGGPRRRCRCGVISRSRGSMIELRGTYRLDDLARHFYFDALRKSWWFIVSIPAGIILIALLVTYITIQNPGIQWHGFQNAIPFGLLLLIWLFLMAVM